MAGMNVSEAKNATNLTATATVFSGPGELLGIWVSSASSTPTIKVEDTDGTTSVSLANTFTPAGPNFYAMPFKIVRGLKVTISGTVDCTVSWQGG